MAPSRAERPLVCGVEHLAAAPWPLRDEHTDLLGDVKNGSRSLGSPPPPPACPQLLLSLPSTHLSQKG